MFGSFLKTLDYNLLSHEIFQLVRVNYRIVNSDHTTKLILKWQKPLRLKNRHHSDKSNSTKQQNKYTNASSAFRAETNAIHSYRLAWGRNIESIGKGKGLIIYARQVANIGLLIAVADGGVTCSVPPDNGRPLDSCICFVANFQ